MNKSYSPVFLFFIGLSAANATVFSAVALWLAHVARLPVLTCIGSTFIIVFIITIVMLSACYSGGCADDVRGVE